MDPQATWDDLLAAYADSEWASVEEAAESLLQWLQRGGVPPQATTGSDMGEAWDCAITSAACRFALHVAGRKDP